MKIWLSEAGKRFNREWIFRNLTYQFESANSYAIIGPNGSGKSTLLQVIAGAMELNTGKIGWEKKDKAIEPLNAYKLVSICAPYLEVIEEMTATEFLSFHSGFKPFFGGLSISRVLESIGLQESANKQIRYYSSGMKQRIKLAQAIFSDTAAVLLDEPCTNLDETGYQLYYSLVEEYCKNRLIIVSSNEPKEYSFCKNQVVMGDWK